MRKLRSFKVFGISSMIRDLALISDNAKELEQKIMNNAFDAIDPALFKDLKILSGEGVKGAVGDLVLFSVKSEGSYKDMETLWGGRVALEIGKHYIGILCERGSTKLMTAEFPQSPFPIPENLELQLIAQGGGIGYVTGFSPQLKNESGYGTARDVLVEGTVYSEDAQKPLNILQTALPAPTKFEGGKIPPNILLLGTATDVGKTTLARHLIGELSKKYACAAVKASGTGWYEDSLFHLEAGAFPVLNYTFSGLATTYYVPEAKYLDSIKAIYWALIHPEKIKMEFIPPAYRSRPLREPEVIITEHGGDIIWANIPSFLRDKDLMDSVCAIVICCESAMALLGALGKLKEYGIENGKIKIYALVPLTNPEAFFKRLSPLIEDDSLAGILDISKPLNLSDEDSRKAYSIHHRHILSPKDFVEITEGLFIFR